MVSSLTLDNTSYVIEHDAHGRVTEGAGGVYDYGPRGRLIRAEQNGAIEWYVYTADGRLARIINGKSRTIVWDGDQMIAGMDSGGTTRWETVWGAGTDQILEHDSNEPGTTGRFVAISDHRNSVVGWWNADDRELGYWLEYTPHGRVRMYDPDGTEVCAEQGTGTDCVRTQTIIPFGFASAYRSERTGITYMRNRWYAPKLGQFLTHDPLGFVDSANPYAYAGFDPINFWDPYGLAKQFARGVEQGVYDKILGFGEFALNTINWIGESITDPVNRRIEDLKFVAKLLKHFANNPEELQRLLPFDEMGEEGRLARLALEDDRQFDAGRHMFKALLSMVLDVGVSGVVAKLGEVAGFGKLLKRMQVEEYGGPGLPFFGRTVPDDIADAMADARRLADADPFCSPGTCSDLADKFIDAYGEGKRLNFQGTSQDSPLPVHPAYNDGASWRHHSVVELSDGRVVDPLQGTVFDSKADFLDQVFTENVSEFD